MDDKYFVITDNTDFNGFILHDGLNIMRFYEHNISNVSFHGFRFKTIDHIAKDYSKGFYIREVTLPKNDEELIFVPKYDFFCSMHANKVILSKRYSLFEPETYERFGLDIRQNKYLVDLASSSGNIEFLNWWLSSDIDLEYSAKSIDEASSWGRVNVLDWWLNSGKQLKYTEYAMDYASWHGEIKVLEWWFNSGLELKYTDSAIDNASRDCEIEVLEWWRLRGSPVEAGLGWTRCLELKYTQAAVTDLHDTKTLLWWFNSGLEVKYSEKLIDYSTPINIIKLWLEFGLDITIQYCESAIDYPSMDGNFEKLAFWFNSGLKLKYTTEAIDYAASAEVLDFWVKYGPEFSYTDKAIKYASYKCRIDVLDWWARQNIYELKYSEKIIDNLLIKAKEMYDEDQIRVLEWWKNSGLEVKYTHVAMDTASRMGRVDILNWWLKSGLELKYSREAVVNIEYDRARVLRWWKNRAGVGTKDM